MEGFVFSLHLAQVPESSILWVFRSNFALSQKEPNIVFKLLSDTSAVLPQFSQIRKRLLCGLLGKGHPINALSECTLWMRPCDNKKLIARYTVGGAIDFLFKSASASCIWYAPSGWWPCQIIFKTRALVGVSRNFFDLQICFACSKAALMHREWLWGRWATFKLLIMATPIKDTL